MSRDMLNTIVIGAVFVFFGGLLGFILGRQGVTAQEVRTIVKDEVELAIESQLSETLTTMSENMSSSGSSSMSEANIEEIVQDAIDESEREQNYMMDDDPYIGPEDAPVVIVEFSDFLCSFCGRHYNETLQPILDTYDGYVRYVYRDFPGVGGSNAVQSAMAAECAHDQNKFWEYHNRLFENQDSLSAPSTSQLQDTLVNHAEAVGLETEPFRTCLEEEEHRADVIGDSSDAQVAGARGTPAFLINGQFVSGARPYETFATLIERELEEKGIDFQAESTESTENTANTESS